MQQGFFFQRLSPSAGQEIPRILWKQKTHQPTHKIAPLVPIVSHIILVHTPSYFFKKHLNMIFPYMSKSSKLYVVYCICEGNEINKHVTITVVCSDTT